MKRITWKAVRGKVREVAKGQFLYGFVCQTKKSGLYSTGNEDSLDSVEKRNDIVSSYFSRVIFSCPSRVMSVFLD